MANAVVVHRGMLDVARQRAMKPDLIHYCMSGIHEPLSLSPTVATRLQIRASCGFGLPGVFLRQGVHSKLPGLRLGRIVCSMKEDGEGCDAVPLTNEKHGHDNMEKPVFQMGGNTISKQLLNTIVAASLTIVFSLSNKVLYKMALVPLAKYPFFLAQLTTFGYIAAYFTILYLRYRAGIVTKQMLELPKGRLIAVGALEALAIASGMASAAVLPGAALPILTQVYLVWQLLLSYSFLGKRYTSVQLAGCLLVIIGVIIVVASGAGEGPVLQHSQILWSVLMMISTGFSAAANIYKEAVFLDARRHIKGGMDIFVVNSYGSGYQALFVLLMLPFLSNLRGIPFQQLPAYFSEGAACFLNVGSGISECAGAPLVPVLYILANLSFNIAALSLLKRTSAIATSLVMTLAVPLGVWCFTLKLPYMGTPSPLPPGLWVGASILVVGLAIYNVASQTKKAKEP